ncbi:MAG: hypothetical protein R3B70_16490 [Polyangiaceae bacterium]
MEPDLTVSPLSVVFIVLAAGLAVACALLASRRAQRIDRMSVPALGDLVRELRKLPVQDRAAELLRRSTDDTWEHRLAREVLDVPEGPARLAAANDVLFDLDHEIDLGKSWTAAAVRIAVAGTCVLGVAAYLTRGGPIALAGALLIGFVGAGYSFFAGERGKERAARRREAFDGLVSALFPEDAAASRAQQRMRRRDRAL